MSDNQVVYPESDSKYGLSGNLESHMMKNSEWGAVAYLSHSQYGIEDEIRKNNYNSGSAEYPVTMTGCGAVTNSTMNEASICGHKYGTVSSYPQSTTGNISGIFDTAGGSWERVMENRSNTIISSGFDGEFFSLVDNQKYYDLYLSTIFKDNTITDYNYCTIETCGGHALSETKSWYDDFSDFVILGEPWFLRGGVYGSLTTAGQFAFYIHTGASHVYYSFRTVIIPKNINELNS